MLKGARKGGKSAFGGVRMWGTGFALEERFA